MSVAKHTGSILVVDDERGMRDFLRICLERAGHEVTLASSGADALRMLSEEHGFGIVLTDLTMPGVDGMEVLRHASTLISPPTVIMMTAFAAADTAVQAMKLGAQDYLVKPFKVDEIQLVVERAFEQRELFDENRRLRDELEGMQSLDRMVGRSDAIKKVFGLVRRVASTNATVLIRGESGTGKELVARALHNLSERADQPFVAVNCGAVPENLMESEFFGHEKGAFTGANSRREGVFEAAGTGTLFLDEVGELDPNMQVKLLRVLQERTIRPVGASSEKSVECRVVAATNRDLEAAVQAGEFRSDLYFRLDVVRIVLPPLRHRREDIPPLIERFFHRFNTQMRRGLTSIEPAALDRLLAHDYPGNIRELENVIERAVALEAGTTLSADHLPEPPRQQEVERSGGQVPATGIDLDGVLADLERQLVVSALERAGGVRKDAADLLGVSLRSLRYRLSKLGIELGRAIVSAGQDEQS